MSGFVDYENYDALGLAELVRLLPSTESGPLKILSDEQVAEQRRAGEVLGV